MRHVADLVREQCREGHEVGIVCDRGGANELGETLLGNLEAHAKLGILRTSMSRLPGPRDLTASVSVTRHAARLGVDVIHGHGAKGGAYARLAAKALRWRRQSVVALYTPHGGSLHYDAGSLQGRLFLGLERWLLWWSDGIIFESRYSERVFGKKVGLPDCPVAVIPNGLRPAEFEVVEPVSDARDFVFIGELRRLKGVDVLIDAVARLQTPREVSALIVGSGPDEAAYRDQVRRLGLEDRVTFRPAMPARRAFALARCLVVPSRAEAFPYIVLEAAAAGIPALFTDVGGIGEIVDGTNVALVRPDDVGELAARMTEALERPECMSALAGELRTAIAEKFTIDDMAASVLVIYRRALENAELAKRGRTAMSHSRTA